MRVLWIVRNNLERHPGGDTTQVLQTRKAVERLGVEIEMTCESPRDLSRFDVAHLFHLDRLWEHLSLCRALQSARLPAVLSTIYWPSDEFDHGGRLGLQGFLARNLGSDRYQSFRQLQRFGLSAMGRRSLRGWNPRMFSFPSAVRYLLQNTAVILPNSDAERIVIEDRFGVVRPAVIVPNAVDAEDFDSASETPWEQRTGILSVGRIEPRKNQLMLIRALRDMQVPLTLVGTAGRFNRSYARQCRAEAGSNTHFVQHQSTAELSERYRNARVHANVSWYETPGLASLEAGLCGCNLVVTRGGSTAEYFDKSADYCRPQDAGSIRTAIESGLSRHPSSELADRIRDEYNWDRTAEATLRGYELAIRSGPSRA